MAECRLLQEGLSPKLQHMEIPISGGDEVIDLNPDEIQEAEKQLLDILAADQNKLTNFLEIAYELMKRGKPMAFERFLRVSITRVALDFGDMGRGDVIIETEGKQKTFNHIPILTAKCPTICDPVPYAQVQRRSRLLLLTTLASYYIELAKTLSEDRTHVYPDDVANEYGPRSKERLLSDATQLLNRADQVDMWEAHTWVGKGNIQLARKAYQQAQYSFEAALSKIESVPGLLGLAASAFKMGKIAQALKSYQKVLRLRPYAKPDDNTNVDALALLSILEWNDLKLHGVAQDMETALVPILKRVVEAQKKDTKNPILSNLLAHSFLRKNEDQKALKLAERSLKFATVDAVRAEALLSKGRALQAQRKYSEAYNCFREAAKLSPESLPIQYALGQLHYYKGEVDEAIQCFEKILAKEPNNIETITKLAFIYSRLAEKRPKAKELYEKLKKLLKAAREESDAANGKPPDGKAKIMKDEEYIDDPDILIAMGSLAEETDSKTPLQVFRLAAQKMEQSGRPVPAELYNNIAALYHMQINMAGLDVERSAKALANSSLTSSKASSVGSKTNGTSSKEASISGAREKEPSTAEELTDAALKYYNLALNAREEQSASSRDAQSNSDDALYTTLTYNKARLCEIKGDLAQAEELHRRVLSRHPAYVESRIRLASIMLAKAQRKEAIKVLTEIGDADPQNVESRLMLGNLLFEGRDLQNARKTFEHVLRNIDSHNSYALCTLGNIWLALARRAPKEPAKTVMEHRRRAWEFFDKSLRLNNLNIYAALGMGILMADSGNWSQASSIFNSVFESAGYVPNAAINLAHAFVEQQQPKNAIALYERVLKRGYDDRDGVVLLSLARAYYIVAKTEKNVDAMKSALQYVQKAARVRPGDLSVFYNVALVKQQYAQIQNDLPMERRLLTELKKAMIGLEASERLFSGLESMEGALGYDKTHARERAKYCKDVKRISEKKIHETEILEMQREKKIAEMEERKRLKEEETERQARLLREEEERREAEIARRQEEMRARITEETERFRAKEEEERLKKEKRKEKHKRTNDDFIENGDDDDKQSKGDGTRRRRVIKRKRRKAEPDEDDRDRRSVSAAASVEDTRASDSDDSRPMRKRFRGKASVLSKEFVSSSDEDGDRGGPPVGRSSSPTGRSASPRESRSPRGHSPRGGSAIPRQSLSPRGRSESPRRRGSSPEHRPPSHERRSLTPEQPTRDHENNALDDPMDAD
ncbi:protein required for normal CLN1 and CLN2 G1 cyclin expression [Borealophlyctis nickersoniae]|nr:protein required for normal CLN1 and CLN2 G1 cyclin expression [Borealophlyctis nickersoniae]